MYAGENGTMKQPKVNCYQCKFFYVTWNKTFPYGCRAMGFKSNKIPCNDVLQASGTECLEYQEKART